MNKKSALDFVYELEKGILEQNEERPRKKTRKAWDILPKNVQRNSYGHIALNIFKSIYPFGFESDGEGYDIDGQLNARQKAAQKFEQLRTRIRNRILNFVDITKRINIEKYKPELYERLKNQALESGQVRLKLPNPLFKDNEVDKFLEQGYDEILENFTENQVKSMIMDPDNPIGQALLKKIDINANLTGHEGEEQKAFSDSLFVKDLGNFNIVGDKEKQKDDSEEEENSISPEAEEDKDDEMDLKKPKIIQSLKGSSLINKENRDIFTALMRKIMNNIKETGFFRDFIQMSRRSTGGSGERGYTSSYGSADQLSGAEVVYKEVMSLLISGVAFNFAIIAVRSLIEYDIKYFNEPEEKAKANIASDLNTIFDVLDKQFKLTGLNFLPDTLDKYKKAFIKIADKHLEEVGYDDDLEDNINYYAKALSQGKIDFNDKVKKAVEDTAMEIKKVLESDDQFARSLADAVLDIQAMRSILSGVDDDLKNKIDEIEKKERQTSLSSRRRFAPRDIEEEQPEKQSFSNFYFKK
ncbi:MAG: hypothetical protein ACOCV1_03600 [Bacillota bacterium]